jgi:ERCC4-related helicase
LRETLALPRDHPPRILVFAQYRDTIQTIQSMLEGQGWKPTPEFLAKIRAMKEATQNGAG